MFEANNLREKYKQVPLPIKASLWYLISSFLQKGISVITTPIFTRVMSTSEYGEFQVYSSWLGIITIIATFCIYYDVCAQGLVKYSERRKSFVSSLQGLTLSMVGICLVIYLLLRNAINSVLHYSTLQMVCMFVMIWATSAYQYWAAEKRVEYDYRRLAALTIIISIIKPVLELIFVIQFTDKVTGRILAVTAAELLCYTGLFVSQMKKGRTFFSKADWTHALYMAAPLIPHYMSQRVLQSADRIMIERMVGSSEAGIYSLAYSISVLMTLFTAAITQTLTPWFYTKIKNKQFDDIPRIVYPVLVFVVIINILLIGFAPEAVAIFAPEPYHAAIWVIPPVAMSVYFIFSYGVFSVFEFYYEQTQYAMVATLVGAILNIALNYICINEYGYFAAGYTTLFCYMLYTTLHYVFMRRICHKYLEDNMVYHIKSLSLITVAFLAVGFILLFTYKWNVARYTTMIMIIIAMIVKRQWFLQLAKQMFTIRKEK